MAIYHLHASVGKRKTGQSAQAKFDYIERRGKYNTRNFEKPDYAKSGNMPEWAFSSPHFYWKAADMFERINGKLFYHIEFALPVELSVAENIKLSQSFCNWLSFRPPDVLGNLPFSLAIHPGKGHNPHCHVMLSERANDGILREETIWFKRANRKTPEAGGALKTRMLQPRVWLEKVRKTWERYANNALESAGCQSRIDHRSYLDQGIDRLPGVHIGPNVKKMEEKGIQTERFDNSVKVAGINRMISQLLDEKTSLEDEISYLMKRKK